MQRQKPNNWSTCRAAERRLGHQEKAPRAHTWHQEGSTLPILHRASPPSLSISLPCFIFLHSTYHPPLTIIHLFVTCLLPVCPIWIVFLFTAEYQYLQQFLAHSRCSLNGCCYMCLHASHTAHGSKLGRAVARPPASSWFLAAHTLTHRHRHTHTHTPDLSLSGFPPCLF